MFGVKRLEKYLKYFNKQTASYNIVLMSNFIECYHDLGEVFSEITTVNLFVMLHR